jgi:hypothetical protein
MDFMGRKYGLTELMTMPLNILEMKNPMFCLTLFSTISLLDFTPHHINIQPELSF